MLMYVYTRVIDLYIYQRLMLRMHSQRLETIIIGHWINSFLRQIPQYQCCCYCCLNILIHGKVCLCWFCLCSQAFSWAWGCSFQPWARTVILSKKWYLTVPSVSLIWYCSFLFLQVSTEDFVNSW